MSVEISNLNYASSYVAANNTTKAAALEEKTESDKTTDATKKTDTYTPDTDKINSMKSELKNNMLAFKQMVFAMFKDQSSFADSKGAEALKDIAVSKDVQASAQEAISEDGYWGVEQTSQRILDFAKALSGGDVSKLAELKDAVQKGFDAAEKAWGGELPEISYQTLEKVMEGFDEWEKNGKIE